MQHAVFVNIQIPTLDIAVCQEVSRKAVLGSFMRLDQACLYQRFQIFSALVVRKADVLGNLTETVLAAGDTVKNRVVAFGRAK